MQEQKRGLQTILAQSLGKLAIEEEKKQNHSVG